MSEPSLSRSVDLPLPRAAFIAELLVWSSPIEGSHPTNSIYLNLRAIAL